MMVMSGRMAQENAIELLKIMNPPSVTYYEDIDDFISLHSIAGEDNAEEEAKKYSVWAIDYYINDEDSFCVIRCSGTYRRD